MPQKQIVHDWSTGSLIISEIEISDDQMTPAGNPPPTEPIESPEP